MKKSRFVDPKELKKIDLGDGDWVKIPTRFSYGFVEKFSEAQGKDTDKITGFLVQFIKEWNLEKDGIVAEITIDNLRELETDIVKIITEEITSMLSLPKVPSPQLNEASEEKNTTPPL